MGCRFWLTLLLLAIPASLLLSLNGCGGGTSTAPTPVYGKYFQHVVIIFQENRTPDNLFQDPVLISRGADIAQSGLNTYGQTIQLGQVPLANNYDLSHAHSAFEYMYDGGAMDGANLVPYSCATDATDCPPANPQYMYVNPADVAPYFAMAEQYAFGDRMFQTNEGPSFPAHQFIISGTSEPSVGSSLFVSENPSYPSGVQVAGCYANPTTVVKLIDPAGIESQTMYPCFEHPTITDQLDAQGVSWRYYSSAGGGSIWTAPNAIQHMCGPNAPIPNATACTGADWTNNVVLSTTDNPAPILTDIANNALPAVSWVIPDGYESDHPSSNDGSGPSWVAAIVNAIGNSSYWANTAIFITWDDWGGWYDHVSPPQVLSNCAVWGCGYVYGFRVPLIVVSPYTKAQYISHYPHDFGSILKFIEETYGLQSLGFADAPADDFIDCFNLGQTPLAFQAISAPLNAAHFLHDRRPQTPPDDD
jgi:phospholipase C